MWSFRDISSLVWQAGAFGGQKNYLVVFQNNNELRPGGGFIGSYGLLKIKNGLPKSFKVQSSNIFDRGIKNPEPAPTTNTVDANLFLKDGAVSGDFPTTARLLTKIYQRQTAESIDGVISITPTVIERLLSFTGSIYVPEYDKQFDQASFTRELQLEVEKGADKQSGRNPKAILSFLAPKLLSSLINIQVKEYPRLKDMISQAILEKQVMIYLADSDAQAKLSTFGLDAALRNNQDDYLSVISGSYGGTKSSQYVDQSISKEVSISDSSHLVTKLTVTRKLNAEKRDCYTDVNDQIERCLIGPDEAIIEVNIPEGSQILAYNNIEKADELSKNNLRVIRFPLPLIPGESKTVSIIYRHRGEVDRSLNYSFKYQKQPGWKGDAFSLYFNLPEYKIVSSKTSSNELQINEHQKTAKGYLKSDAVLDVELKK